MDIAKAVKHVSFKNGYKARLLREHASDRKHESFL